MIVSHSREFIFVAVPKTGSQSVRLALRPHLGQHDWEQCGLFERKRFPVPALARLEHGHISCRELQPFLLPEIWSRYRKFAFVRNPIERFRSLVRFWFGAGPAERDLGRFKNILVDPRTRVHPLVRPQADFLCDANGEPMVDEIGSFAALQADFNRIAESLKLPASPLPVRNTSPLPGVEMEFDQELLEMIRDFYRVDFLLPGLAPC